MPEATTRTRNRRTADAPPADELIIPNGQHWQNPTGEALPIVADDPEEPPELTAADRVAAMLSDVRGDERAKVKVYRRDAQSRMEWCADLTPEEFEEMGFEGIRSRWGAGEYRLALYGTTNGKAGEGRGFGYRASQTVIIAPDLRNGSGSAPAGVPSGLAQVLETMARNQQAMLEAITNRPQTDQLAQFQTMLGLMSTMREAMGLGDVARAPAPKSLLEQLAELKQLKDMLPELGVEPKTEEADPLLSLVSPILEIVKGAQGQPAQAGAVVMPAVSLPASVAAAPIPQPGAQAPDTMPTIEDPQQAIAALQKHLRNLVKLAAANVDPELGADMVYDNLPDELVDVLGSDQWFTMLEQFEPSVTPHRDWFQKARDIAVRYFEEGHPDDLEEPGNDAAASGGAPGGAA